MRFVILLLSFICVLCQRSLAQNADELALTFHTQLNEKNYVPAKKTMLQLKRKLTYQLLNYNTCLFSEYIEMCNDNRIEIDELKEAGLYVDMLRTVYKSEPSIIAKNLKLSLESFCHLKNGKLSEFFFESLKEDEQMGVKEKLGYQYQIAWAYNSSLNPYKAWQLFKINAEQYSKIDSMSVEYAQNLNGMAFESRYIGRDDLALPLYKKIGRIYESRNSQTSKDYARNCDNIGATLLTTYNKPDSALKYITRAYNIFKNLNDTSESMCIILNNLACCYGRLNQKEKELYYLQKALKYHEDPSLVYNNIGNFYKIQKDVKTALHFYHQTNENYQKSLCATGIAECYAALGDYNKFYYYESCFFDYYKTVLRNNFREMIGSDRSSFCTKGHDCHVDSLFRISRRLNTPNLVQLCYDYLVFEKSQSLSCDQSIESIVATCSKEVRSKYADLVRAKKFSDKNTSEYEALELEFLKLLNQEVDYTNFLQINHQEIGRGLEIHDVAIEFFAADKHDENRIYALILNSNGDVIMENICTSDNPSAIKEIWKKLDPYLQGVKRIYFSPDGILHTLPLESYMSRKDVAIYRLSSTREIITRKKLSGQGVAIYGGLFYDTPITTLEADAKKYQQKKQIINLDGARERGALSTIIPYLKGTRQEAEIIAKICHKIKNQCLDDVQLYSGHTGTEASFNNLSGRRIRLIHIATHGYYDQKEEPVDRGDYYEIFDERIKNKIIEDYSLKRCGLLLSGAGTSIDYEVSNLSNNDGILTAYDISKLDLRGLDLVSLSGCETGLGDLSSDGVFGLQRGFKKAGANSILMSLWKVDDEATCLLMTEFYKNWIGNGKTKYEALELAKQTVRSHREKGWDDPEYWAAFILLDGLN